MGKTSETLLEQYGEFPVILMVHLWERYGNRLRRIILFHVWTSNFSICLWVKPKTFHFHEFGIFGRVHDSRKKYYLIFGDTRITEAIRKIPKSCWAIWFVEITNCGFLKILSTRSIFSRKHGMGILVIWNQSLPKNIIHVFLPLKLLITQSRRISAFGPGFLQLVDFPPECRNHAQWQ